MSGVSAVWRHLAAVLATCGMLAGCAAYGSPEQQAAATCRALGPSTLIGGAGGAVGGAAIGAAAGGGRGALIGAGVGLLAGLVAGAIKDRSDCAQARTALAAMAAAASGQPVDYVDPGSGAQVSLIATSDAAMSGGELCRPYRKVTHDERGVVVDSSPGITCQNAQHDWYVRQAAR